MKQTKRLGRGLEDFSHLFLSSKPEKGEHSSNVERDALNKGERANTLRRVICITSYEKVGERAFLTVHLALGMAREGKRVLVFDADFSLPRLCMLMDVPARNSFLHFITKDGKEGVGAEGVNGVKLITLDVDISDMRSLQDHERTALRRCFQSAEEEVDIVLVNSSPAFLNHMRTILKACGESIVVTPQPVTEMISAYGLIKLIFQVNRDAKVGIVSSRVSTRAQAEEVFKKMQGVVKKFLNKPLQYYGYIPEDEEIALSLARREPLSRSSPHSDTVRCVIEISRAILNREGWEREGYPKGADHYNSFAERLFTTSLA